MLHFTVFSVSSECILTNTPPTQKVMFFEKFHLIDPGVGEVGISRQQGNIRQSETNNLKGTMPALNVVLQ